MSVTGPQRFWNRVAARYAARPLKDVAAYEALLGDVAGRLQPTDTVLEIGCGTGGTAIRLAPRVAHWLATDFSSEMVRIAQAKPGGDTVPFAVIVPVHRHQAAFCAVQAAILTPVAASGSRASCLAMI